MHPRHLSTLPRLALALTLCAAGCSTERDRYELEHASGGYSPTCASVSVTDRSTGYADFRDGQLVLRPTERTLEVHTCDEHGTRTLPTTPLVFQARVSPYQTWSDEPSLQVELSGGPYPLTLKRLDPLPPLRAPERALPPGFQLGAVTGYQDMFGTWAPRDADLSFFDPATGTAHFLADNLAENRMLRLSPGQYELASYVMHTGGTGGGRCKRDVIYYERGATLFNLLVRVNDDVEGDVQFEGQTATLVVRIRDCGADDGTTTYTIAPGTSWARWAFHARLGVQLGCIYPRSPTQFTMCTNRVGFTTYSPR